MKYSRLTFRSLGIPIATMLNLIYSGVDVRTVMDYAGHKNPDVTLKIYAQAKSAEKRTESAKQINEVFPSDPTT